MSYINITDINNASIPAEIVEITKKLIQKEPNSTCSVSYGRGQNMILKINQIKIWQIFDCISIAYHFIINLPLEIQNKYELPRERYWDKYLKDGGYPTMYLFWCIILYVS